MEGLGGWTTGDEPLEAEAAAAAAEVPGTRVWRLNLGEGTGDSGGTTVQLMSGGTAELLGGQVAALALL